jgi:hypothetical protein
MTPRAFYQAKHGPGGVDSAAHIAMAKLLRRDPSEEFALAPFAPMKIDGAWYIGATRAPLAVDLDAEILIIDGKTGGMRFGDDAAATGFWGSHYPCGERLHLYSNGITLARDWAAARADIFAKMARVGMTSETLLNASHLPGVAMIGEPQRLANFADIAAASTIEIDNPRLRQPLTDAMLRAARLPVVTAMHQDMKVAA